MATASVNFTGERLDRDVEADVAIIGGGYTGLSTAYHLAKAGKSVVLLEKETIASGASGRNAAGWMPGWPGPSPHDVRQAFGPEKGDQLNQMIVDASNEFPHFVRTNRLDPEFSESGVAMCAPTIALGDKLRAIADQWRELSVEIDDVPTETVSELTGCSAFSAAAIYRKAGTLNPVNYSRGLAKLTVEAGVKIFEHSEVTDVVQENDDWVVRSEYGSVRANYVIAATGAYSAERPLAKLGTGQYKIPAMVFASKPAPEIVARLMPQQLPIASNHPIKLFWIMSDGAGRLVGSMLYPSNNKQSFRKLALRFEAHLKAYYPDMPSPEWDRAWSGYLDIIPGRVVQILELAPRLLAPIGYSGSGSIAAFGVGKELAKAIACEDLKNCPVPIRRPSRVWGTRFVPWLTRALSR